ncbi:MAG: metallophosphoesterase [Proteobacteria bacterium]|nr:metallophosphoesterase [Pseudomonadota bacterium]
MAGGCQSPSCPSWEGAPRDFTTFPTIVDRPSFTQLYAISDVHGGYDRLVALLVQAGLIGGAPAQPAEVAWTGGDATLVVTGDLIDKGDRSVEVIELLRALELAATDGGGHVVVTLGNHEAEFLADPYNSKADAFDGELATAGLDPCIVATTDPRGTWLRSRPFGARIGGWFFAHAGDTHGLSLGDLTASLEDGLRAHDFADATIIGADSILEARAWWEASVGRARAEADALDVAHLVFGHTPDALGPRGAIAVGEAGVLFRIDVGMSPAVDDSAGALLAIVHDGLDDVATELRPDGGTRALWRGPSR